MGKKKGRIIAQINWDMRYMDVPVEILGWQDAHEDGTLPPYNGEYEGVREYADNYLENRVLYSEKVNGDPFYYYRGESASDIVTRIFDEFRDYEILFIN